MDKRKIDFIAIGASAGGVAALQNFFRTFKNENNIPIGVVLHLPSHSSVDPALVFQKCSQNRVMEANDKMPIEKGNIYFAPPGYHLLIENSHSLALNVDAPENYSRPSIDVFFDSAARVFGERCCGILMTGASVDGAKGLLNIQSCGGMTVVQDPQEAEVATMPEAALRLIRPSCVDEVEKISDFLYHTVRGGLL